MTEQRIRVGPEIELAVTDWAGDGTAFLLVHGLASNARLWDGVATELANDGHRVVAVDLRGHGRSDKPDEGYDFATIAADLRTVVDERGLDRPVAVGQSWGANVVLELAARWPDRTRGVVCVDGGWSELQERFPDWDECARQLAPPRLAGLPAVNVERRIREMHPDWPNAGITGVLANFEVRADGTIAPWLTFEHHMTILRELWAHHPTRVFGELEVPVLLVPADTGDPAWTGEKRASIDRAERMLPRVRTRWFAPADHDIHAQHPVELADALVGALEEGFFE